ncbi:MAG: hypothetical protein FWD16_06085 [Clostridia bacterium]|nr:hypothetical protein [Clostridia bacterium]
MKNNRFPYEREINEIRAKLYEESKDIPVEEQVRRGNELAHELARQYGFKVVPSRSIKREA